MAIHVQVDSYADEGNERLVKRFLKKCKKENLHQIFMEKCCRCKRYEKKSVRDRREKNFQIWRHKKRMEEEKENDKKCER